MTEEPKAEPAPEAPKAEEPKAEEPKKAEETKAEEPKSEEPKAAFPIARWGQPEDVARAVRAFCSDDFAYTTGNYIDVDGGFHIRRL